MARTGDFSGKYKVESDCTYSDEFTVTGTPAPGLTLHHQDPLRVKAYFRKFTTSI